MSSGASSGSSDATRASPPAPSDSSGASGAATRAGAAVDDSVITTKVKAALLADPDIKGTDVSVETKGGEVTLTGTVKSQAQMDRVQKIALNTDGVKGVQNKVAVKP